MANNNQFHTSDAPPPPGFSNEYVQSSYNRPQVPAQTMSSTFATGGNPGSTWNFSQMSFRPPFPGTGNIGAPPVPFPYAPNPSLPPHQTGYQPLAPPGVPPSSPASHPGGSLHPGPVSHPPSNTGFYSGPGPNFVPPPGPPPGNNFGPHPHSASHSGRLPSQQPGQYYGPPPGQQSGQYFGPPPGQQSGPLSGSLTGQYGFPHSDPPTGQQFGQPHSQQSGPYSGQQRSQHPGLLPQQQSNPLPGPNSYPLSDQQGAPHPSPHQSVPNTGPPYDPRPGPQFGPQSGSRFGPRFDHNFGPRYSSHFAPHSDPSYQRQAYDHKQEDEATIQRRKDQKWIDEFLQSKGRSVKKVQLSENPPPSHMSVGEMKNALYGTARLVTQLSTVCESLMQDVDQNGWNESYLEALKMKEEIQSRLKVVSDKDNLEKVKTKLTAISKKRTRKRKAKLQLQMEEPLREARIAEKDAAVEMWRKKKIQEAEEKKKEQELKEVADAVLCDIRKKLSDVKRAQDILKSLEKLRKLRKEATMRKGIHTDLQSDEAFSSLLEELRSVAKRRLTLYGREEKTLMVMLEGEQEEERKRVLELQHKKDKDKHMRRKRKIDSMMFGEDTPPDPFMQPFRQYYTQAQESLPALVQIRREWDAFLVPAEHPEGWSVPLGWVFPEPPSDQSWAEALHTSDTDCEDKCMRLS